MPETFLGYNGEEGGVRQEIWYDEHTDTLTFRDLQVVEDVLDENRRERNNEHGKPFGEWKRIAQIPALIVNQLMREGIWDNKERLKKWLNDQNNIKMRTKEGRL
jgi:hypothetical protein